MSGRGELVSGRGGHENGWVAWRQLARVGEVWLHCDQSLTTSCCTCDRVGVRVGLGLVSWVRVGVGVSGRG